MWIVYIFFLLPTLLLCREPQQCQLTRQHTICKYKWNEPGTRCRDMINNVITKEESNLILDMHNSYRQLVATGGERRGKPGPQPMAADMLEMEWDNELATAAQLLANQCKYGHDCLDCRKTTEFLVGQNLYQFSENIENPGSNWPQAINAWYNEVAIFDKKFVEDYEFIRELGHFTQIVWSETYKLGCGYAFYQDKKWFRKLYICNYGPAGNIITLPMYYQGAPCTECPEDTICSSKYYGLCTYRKSGGFQKQQFPALPYSESTYHKPASTTTISTTERKITKIPSTRRTTSSTTRRTTISSTTRRTTIRPKITTTVRPTTLKFTQPPTTKPIYKKSSLKTIPPSGSSPNSLIPFRPFNFPPQQQKTKQLFPRGPGIQADNHITFNSPKNTTTRIPSLIYRTTSQSTISYKQFSPFQQHSKFSPTPAFQKPLKISSTSLATVSTTTTKIPIRSISTVSADVARVKVITAFQLSHNPETLLVCDFDEYDCPVRYTGASWILQNSDTRGVGSYYKTEVNPGQSSSLYMRGLIHPPAEGIICITFRYQKYPLRSTQSVPLRITASALRQQAKVADIEEDSTGPNSWLEAKVTFLGLDSVFLLVFQQRAPIGTSIILSLDDIVVSKGNCDNN